MTRFLANRFVNFCTPLVLVPDGGRLIRLGRQR